MLRELRTGPSEGAGRDQYRNVRAENFGGEITLVGGGYGASSLFPYAQRGHGNVAWAPLRLRDDR